MQMGSRKGSIPSAKSTTSLFKACIWLDAGRQIEPKTYQVYTHDMIDWSTCSAVERDPQRMSGAWVFLGTRVPVAALFENLEDGAQLSQFLEWVPGLTLDQARAVLEYAAHSLEST